MGTVTVESDSRRWLTFGAAVGIIQTLVATVAFVLFRTGSILAEQFGPVFREIVIGVNFPVVAIWVVICWPLNYLAEPTGVFRTILTVVFAFVLAASVAVFWSLVFGESYSRCRGRTLLRRFNRASQSIIVIAMLLIGIGMVAYGYVASRPFWFVTPVKALTFGLLPLVWGCLFITVSFDELLTNGKGRSGAAL